MLDKVRMDPQRSARQRTMQHHLGYIITATKCSGFFIQTENAKWSGKTMLLMIYHGVFEIAAWANIIRFFFAYEPNESFSAELMLKVYIHIMYLFVALTYTMSFIISGKARSVLKLWDDYHMKHNCEFDPAKVKKHSVIVLAVAALVWTAVLPFILVSSSDCTLFIMYSLRPFSDNLTSNDIPIYMRILAIFTNTLIIFTYTVFIAWLVVLGLALKDEFMLVGMKLCKNKEEHNVNIEAIRKQHFELSIIIREVDGIVSLNVLFIFITHIPTACINIYLLLLWEHTLEQRALLISALLFKLTIIHLVIAVGTMLNEKVIKHGLYHYHQLELQ